ncbi:unnamed protein product, partial [Haemonchus placei]|uniref:Transposase n=1 Tax=Haemonchus placei TaxID=6290 RepID=A0A0N4W7X5_HAEPC
MSVAEILTCFSALVAMQIRSEIAAAVEIAQHEPQFAWSRMVN